MARRAAATQQREPASLPDVLVPLSDVPEHQRAAYELELIDNPEEFRKVVSSEDFFSLIANFPTAWWGERLSMYLYRHEDDGGMMIKNAEGEGKYIKPIIRQAVDRDWIASRNGGGKFQLWLNLSEPGTRRQTTVRKYTFRIDGPPAVKEGQIIEVNGKPVSVGSAAPTNQPSETAQIITAQADAARANNDLVKEGMKSVLDMQTDLTRKQLGLDAPAAKDPLDTAIRLMEVLRPTGSAAAPAQDPMTAALALLERMEAIIDKRIERIAPKDDTEKPDDETIFERGAAIVERVTGKSLAQVMGKAATADATPGWVNPVLTIAGNFIQQLPTLLHQAAENRRVEFDRQVYLANLQRGGQPPNPTAPRLPAPTAAVAPPPAQTATQPQTIDPGQLMNALVVQICTGFDKAPVGEWGEQCAAAMDFQFSNLIESMGIDQLLCNSTEVRAFVAGHPELKKRSEDARWVHFEEDFLSYCADRWGSEDEGEAGKIQAIDGQGPPAA